ncbi:YqcC family protein [Pseudohalioglobus lutimaris]|uniref:Pseudouridine synthase n=1 Tax=Pseudohalioglobus lutimaris TaxID=1737061 RepID=A0A2N5WZ35_9GAMM|nr:YqcC family protein [Pseudohalioglobus lutimaris]PLW67493.1 pseudouridine synthase [Pseudohalioglobus lutimaris]
MHTEIAEVLIDIEAHLRRLNMWEQIPPSTQALASSEPFCVDTMTLTQWLQFVFIPTIYQMIEDGESLPEQCGIAPMGEAFFRDSSHGVEDLIASLRKIDELLSAGGSR